MARKKTTNIMRVFVGDRPLMDAKIAGERLLCFPTSVAGWEIALGEKDAPAIRDALNAFIDAGTLTTGESDG